MNVGWLGLGKLGLPCANALASCGHHVTGYDPRPPAEPGDVKVATLADVVGATDGIVIACIQTPHLPAYGGETPMPDRPADFDYSALVSCVREVAAEARAQDRGLTLVVISTVLPGTTRARLLPLLRGSKVSLVYGPYFPAMGTEREDFLDPEFQLLGSDDPVALERAAALYRTVHDRPIRTVSIESAELAKVAYNCFISVKIVFANMLAEICDATGADVDEVTGTLALATRRLLSPAYMRAGMGDGGACHPRDNQAMSWLADRIGLSADLMGFVSGAREDQSMRLAELVRTQCRLTGFRDPVLLGKAFKPGVEMTAGSPALLLAAQLEGMQIDAAHYDLRQTFFEIKQGRLLRKPRVFVITTAHPEFADLEFPAGSVVIDPHGYIPSRPGVVLITPGRKGGACRT
jgi:UDPglucose 6-dehydrogenase